MAWLVDIGKRKEMDNALPQLDNIEHKACSIYYILCIDYACILYPCSYGALIFGFKKIGEKKEKQKCC